MADVLSCRAAAPRRRARVAMSRVAVLKGGRSLERQVSLRSGARVEDALRAARATSVVAIDVGRDLVERLLRERSPTWRSSRCTAATARTAPCRSCSRCSASPTPARARAPACAAGTRSLAKHLMRDAGIPTPDFYAFSETAFHELGAAEALPAIEERLDFPIVVKPAAQGSALGIKFAAHARRTSRPRWSPRSPTTARCCSSATSRAATWRCRCSTATAARRRCRSSRPIPARSDFYDFEARYEIGRTRLRLPGRRSATRSPRARRSSRSRSGSCSAAPASRAST